MIEGQTCPHSFPDLSPEGIGELDPRALGLLHFDSIEDDAATADGMGLLGCFSTVDSNSLTSDSN